MSVHQPKLIRPSVYLTKGGARLPSTVIILCIASLEGSRGSASISLWFDVAGLNDAVHIFEMHAQPNNAGAPAQLAGRQLSLNLTNLIL